MEYIRLNEGLNSYTLIPATEDIWDHIKYPDSKDYYVSIFKYTEEQYQLYKKKGSVSGIKDVKTSQLVFDFDDRINIENARNDSVTLVSRLLSHGVKQDNISICFSGKKGFGVTLNTTEIFTPEEFKNITFTLASDLKTFDKQVHDPSRIIRVAGTVHQDSKLYKFPLSISQLSELPIKDILTLATSWSNVNPEIFNTFVQAPIPSALLSFKTVKKEKKEVVIDILDFDISKKPKWLSAHKFALQEGFFRSGERNLAFMILASTYKNQGFSKEIVYRMLKGVAEKQAKRDGSDPFSNKELWENISNVVFSPNWKGGSYSYDNTPLLQEIGQRLNIPKEKEEEQVLVPVENITSIFRKFATEIDKNTIKLGIPIIDDSIRITTSMSVGLLGGPGCGKTSLAFGILNSNSLTNIPSIFFSLDMGAPLVYQRLIQKHLGYQSKKIFSIYQNNEVAEIKKIETTISNNYKNVRFCFRSGISIEDIRNNIIKYQESSSEKIKLVVIDYLETINGPYSDSTANSGYISQAIKDIANDLELTVILLLQPQKSAGDPSSELISYRAVKGSSQIEQSLSTIFTLWRPGFSPITPENDKYASIAVVKNRMGSLAKFDFSWDGLTGDIQELDEEQEKELKEIVAKKAMEKAMKDLI